MKAQASSPQQKVIASCIVVVVVALLALAANAVTKKDIGVPQPAAPSATTTTPTSPNTPTTTPNAAAYKDGVYAADSSYRTPGGTESLTAHLTVKDGAVTDTAIDQQTNNRESAGYQAAFQESYASYVVGKSLDSIYVSHVSGSSLTSQGFNNALEQIKSQAKA